MTARQSASQYRIQPPVQPTLAAADRAVDAALALAAERGVAIAIAIVDASGYALCVKRMEGARPITAPMAMSKAWTAMMNRRDTASLQEMTVPDAPAFGFQFHFPGQVSVLPGGVPVTSSQGIHAAVGASGADKDSDTECAAAACKELVRLMVDA